MYRKEHKDINEVYNEVKEIYVYVFFKKEKLIPMMCQLNKFCSSSGVSTLNFLLIFYLGGCSF